MESFFLEARKTILNIDFERPDVALSHQLGGMGNRGMHTNTAVLMGVQVGGRRKRCHDEVLEGSVFQTEIHCRPQVTVTLFLHEQPRWLGRALPRQELRGDGFNVNLRRRSPHFPKCLLGRHELGVMGLQILADKVPDELVFPVTARVGNSCQHSLLVLNDWRRHGRRGSNDGIGHGWTPVQLIANGDESPTLLMQLSLNAPGSIRQNGLARRCEVRTSDFRL